jgi:hypothetical protein
MSKKIKSNQVKTEVNVETVSASRLENSIALTVTTRKWGNRRKARISQLTENENGESTGVLALAETTRLKASKQLIVSEEYNEIVTFQQKVYSQIVAISVPSFIKEGFYFVAAERVNDVVRIMEESRPKLAELVEKFLGVYSTQIEESKAAFAGGTLFRESDYPTVDAMRELFTVEFYLFRFEVAQGLPPEIAQAEALKLKEAFKRSEVLIEQCLVDGFSELLAGVQKRLAPDKDGKAQAFHKTLFDNLAEFMTNFSSRNLVQSKDLAALVDKANGILKSVRGDKIQDKALVVKSSDTLRDTTRAQFASLQAEIEKDIKPKLNRAFNFDLDD